MVGGNVIVGTRTAANFMVNISYSADFLNYAQCVLTFTSGANTGLSRTITNSAPNNNKCELSFSRAFISATAVNDTFTIAVAFATRTEVLTMADFTLATGSRNIF